jgi:hypothetical protein
MTGRPDGLPIISAVRAAVPPVRAIPVPPGRPAGQADGGLSAFYHAVTKLLHTRGLARSRSYRRRTSNLKLQREGH